MQHHVNEGRTYGVRDARSVAEAYSKHARTASDGAIHAAASRSHHDALGAEYEARRKSMNGRTTSSYELEPGEVLEANDAGRARSPSVDLGRTYNHYTRSLSPVRHPSLPPRPVVPFPGGSPPPVAQPKPKPHADPRRVPGHSLSRSMPASASLPPEPASPDRARSTSIAPAQLYTEVFGGDFPPKGILKTNGTSAKSNAIVNGKGPAKSTTAKTGPTNCLQGQKVRIKGTEKPIKPYTRTIDHLTKYGPAIEAFEDRAASSYEANDIPGTGRKATCLEVYFPLRQAKFHANEPSECLGICRGAPHPDFGPVCRFCRNLIEPKNRGQVYLPCASCVRYLVDGPVFPFCQQHVYSHSVALRHLSAHCQLPQAERQLLLTGFQDVDSHALPSGKSGTQPNAQRHSYEQPRKRQTSAGPSTSRAGGSRSIAVKRHPINVQSEADRLRQNRLHRERFRQAEQYEKDEAARSQGWGMRPGDAPYKAAAEERAPFDESDELESDHVQEVTADGDDDFTYSRVASNEPPVRAPMKTPDKNGEDRQHANRLEQLQEEDEEVAETSAEQDIELLENVDQESSVDSMATANQDFYTSHQKVDKPVVDDQQKPITAAEPSFKAGRESVLGAAASLDLLQSVEEAADMARDTYAPAASTSRTKGRDGSSSTTNSDIPMSELVSDANNIPSTSRLSVPQSIRGTSSSSGSRAPSESTTTRRKVVMETSEPASVPRVSSKKPSSKNAPVQKAASASKPPRRTAVATTIEISSPEQSTSKLHHELFEQEEKSSEEDSDGAVRPPQVASSRPTSRKASPAASTSSAHKAGSVKIGVKTTSRQASRSGSPEAAPTVSADSSSDEAEQPAARRVPQVQVYAADAREGESSSSDDGVYVSSWNPSYSRQAGPSTSQPQTKRSSKVGSSPASSPRKASKPDKRGKRKASTSASSSSSDNEPLRKKAGAAARKSGRPSQQHSRAAIAEQTPSPRRRAASSGQSSSSRKKPATVPRPTGSQRRKSTFVRQDAVSSESDDTSSDTDSDNRIVPDDVELTDQDTEEELAAPRRIKRSRVRSSPAVQQQSSPPKAAKKRKRIQESSEEDDGEQGDGDEDEASEDEVPRPRGRLVKARDYRPPRRRKGHTTADVDSQSNSKPVNQPTTATFAETGPTKILDDFPSILDEYRDILLSNDVTSMSELQHAVKDPTKAIKFVEYLAEVSLHVRFEAEQSIRSDIRHLQDSDHTVLKRKVYRFAFSQAIEAALTDQ